MARKFCIALLFVSLLAIAQIAAAQPTESNGGTGLDLVAWERLAVRAEEVVAVGVARDSALLPLRSQLVEWKERAAATQEPLADRIDRLNSQIAAALGEPVGEEGTESEQVADRSAELAEELESVFVPYQIAEGFKRRAGGKDPRRVEKIQLEIAAEHPNVLSDPPPRVVFQQFGADALESELRVILDDVNYILSAKSDLNFAIAEGFQWEGISIPFLQRDIWIRNSAELGDSLSPRKSVREAE